MNIDRQPEEMSPAELQLAQHLALLRDTPDPPASLVDRVVRTARWQQAVRPPLLTLAHLASATVDGIKLLLGGRS